MLERWASCRVDIPARGRGGALVQHFVLVLERTELLNHQRSILVAPVTSDLKNVAAPVVKGSMRLRPELNPWLDHPSWLVIPWWFHGDRATLFASRVAGATLAATDRPAADARIRYVLGMD